MFQHAKTIKQLSAHSALQAHLVQLPPGSPLATLALLARTAHALVNPHVCHVLQAHTVMQQDNKHVSRVEGGLLQSKLEYRPANHVAMERLLHWVVCQLVSVVLNITWGARRDHMFPHA
jgi:hypothetical protein